MFPLFSSFRGARKSSSRESCSCNQSCSGIIKLAKASIFGKGAGSQEALEGGFNVWVAGKSWMFGSQDRTS